MNERFDLVRRRQNLHLPRRKTLVRIAHSEGLRMPAGDRGLVERNAHVGSPFFCSLVSP
jgi:hypothetical protein